MKAILEFDLDDPDDALRHEQCLAGQRALLVIYEMDRKLRDVVKYSNDPQSAEAADRLRADMHSRLAEHGIDLEALLP
jgi:hypothetical protein